MEGVEPLPLLPGRGAPMRWATPPGTAHAQRARAQQQQHFTVTAPHLRSDNLLTAISLSFNTLACPHIENHNAATVEWQ